MVNNTAQLYTVEGIAAAVLMVVTAYLILNSTILLTPGDTHIIDVQLEQVGNDVLRMMDTATYFDETKTSIYEKKKSFLEEQLSRDLSDLAVKSSFTKLFSEKFRTYSGDERLHVYPRLYYWDTDTSKRIERHIWNDNSPFAFPLTYRDHYVTVTRWVYLHNPEWDGGTPKSVLLEVLLWRD